MRGEAGNEVHREPTSQVIQSNLTFADNEFVVTVIVGAEEGQDQVTGEQEVNERFQHFPRDGSVFIQEGQSVGSHSGAPQQEERHHQAEDLAQFTVGKQHEGSLLHLQRFKALQTGLEGVVGSRHSVGVHVSGQSGHPAQHCRGNA